MVFDQALNEFLRGQKGVSGNEETVSAGFISHQFQTKFKVIGQLFEEFFRVDF